MYCDVLFWDLKVNGERSDPQTLGGHSAKICSLSFSPDGKLLASADESGMLIIWCTEVIAK